jgi:hypothetical protein
MNCEIVKHNIWNLPDLVLFEILKNLRKTLPDIVRLSLTCKIMHIFINHNFSRLYHKHLKVDDENLKWDFTKPVLSLEVICRGEDQQSNFLLKTIEKLSLHQIIKLDIKCQNKTSIAIYLEVREQLLKSINKISLEDFSMDYCFLKTGHKTDHILERFSTNWFYPNISMLTIRFFENVRQDWCDHNSNTLKRHLYGILQTNNVKTVQLVNLDNDSFHSTCVFLDNLKRTEKTESITKRSKFNPLLRKLSYKYELGDLTTNFVINIE